MKTSSIYQTLDEYSCISHYNLLNEAKADLGIPEKVLIRDVTLREGEQAAFSGFSLEDKIRISKLLDEIGVDYIQVGYPGYSKSQTKMTKAIVSQGLKARIDGICLIFIPEWREQIEAATEAGIDIASLAYGMSDIRLQKVNRVSRQQALERCTKAVEYASSHDLSVKFTPTDTTRIELKFLKRIYREIVDAGASMIGIADTAGAIGPIGMRFLVKQVKNTVNIPISVHCHNDFGLAMANSLAAIEAGAEVVDVAVNGLGERAGNTPLAQAIMTLKYLYNFDLDVKASKLREVSKLVSKMSGINVPSNYPLTGDFAFTHIVGTHQWGVKQAWYAYEPIKAEAVGNKRRLPLGRLTDYRAVQGKLDELGIPVEDERILKEIASKVRSLAAQKENFVTEQELCKITSETLSEENRS